MPGSDHATIASVHGCKEVIELVSSSLPDLKDQAIDNADDSWFMDGSIFIEGGQRKAGYPMASLMKTIEANPLPTDIFLKDFILGAPGWLSR